MTNYLMNVLFCVICALMLYELSGFIGKEMLSDKHITGKGKGYCDITFGKENKKSLIVNIQYNIFAPIIYMLLIAALLQYVGMQELSQKAVYIVPCYYVVRGFMITVVSGKHQLYNLRYECQVAIPGIALAFFVQKVLILSGKSILPTVEEFRTQLWLFFFVIAYQFCVRIAEKSSALKQNRVCTPQMKQKYILDKYDLFRRKYGSTVSEVAPGNYLQRVIYSIMIYEDYNRTAIQRWFENILFFLGKRPMTLGIMQVKTTTFLHNAESVELGCKKIKKSFEEYVEEVKRENRGELYYFGAGEPELCLKKICKDYNGAKDYTKAVKYIFYILPGPECDYDETQELLRMEEQHPEYMTPGYKRVDNLYEFALYIGTCSHVMLREDYYLSSLDFGTHYFSCYPSETGTVFCVENVENVSIVGEDAMIYMGGGDTLVFRNCRNLNIRNVGFIRQAEQNFVPAVLQFENCEEIHLESIECMGRGGRTVEIKHCVQVGIKNIKLHDCRQGAVLVEQSDIFMENSQIRHVTSLEDNAVIAVHSGAAVLKEVIIDHSQAEHYLIQNKDSKLECDDVLVHHCECAEICNHKLEGICVTKEEA